MAQPAVDRPPSPADIESAAVRIRGSVLRTPLRYSPWLSRAAGASVYLKIESLQPTFSFKLRGALNAVLRAREAGGLQPIVTASAGNHGRAIAHAAKHAGASVTVYAPRGAPRSKLDAIRALGAQLELCADYDEAERRAKEAAGRGTAFISAYSHPDVIAGAGTIGLEILDQRPETSAIVVPVGGGGLISGVAIATEGRATVLGVEAAASTAFARSLEAGKIAQFDVQPTIADGLAGNLDPDTITFDIVRRLAPGVVAVDDDELRRAIVSLLTEERLVVEAAGAAGAAAVAGGRLQLRGQTVAVVISGANIDNEVLRALL
jgi:threonine dehydratase